MAAVNGNKTALPETLLRGRVAIVTGGARGIGRATVIRLAEAGADVVINYARNEEAAAEVARRAREFGVQALPLRADVSDVAQTNALVDETVKHFGRVDLLVANAGIWEGAPVEEMSEALWDRVIDANLKGTWTACRAVVPFMKKQGSGAIVIVSSTAGQRGEAGYSNYAASKGGQISFTKSLAVELAPSIRVNSVAPGWVDTELNDVVFGDAPFKLKIVDTIPLGRVATADDIAFAIAFLASDWAASITGEILNVNGGSVLCG
ncbi:MAG: 3-oxoacyl-ACP reductase FabG [Acidobacteriota bacterium]|nr:3-oxoacyl-ACP reductase FabG [Acidobacteriota bacterium]